MTSQDDVIQWRRHSLMRRGSSWASMIRDDRYCSYFPCAFCNELLRDAKKYQQIRKENDVGNLSVLSFLAKRAEMDFFLSYYRGLWDWLTLKLFFYTNLSKKIQKAVNISLKPLGLCLKKKKIALFFSCKSACLPIRKECAWTPNASLGQIFPMVSGSNLFQAMK